MTSRATSLAALVTVGVAVGIVAAPGAPAAAPAATHSVTLLLRAPHPAGLDRLARATGLSHAQRVSRLARLVPSQATATYVRQTLARDDLRVSGETAWSITASGAAPRLAGLFGTRPTADAISSRAGFRAATGALPRIPDDLTNAVSLALATTGGPALFQHAATPPVNGRGFRDAYTSKHTRPPGAGRSADGRSTIATLQLADYNSSDLTNYARKQKLPRIVGTRHYRKVTVDGGPSASDDSSGGDVEVDLDQESILSTAPSARQRPYFAPNTNAGFVDVFANVFDDVVQNRHDNHGGDPHIVALSTSWGSCEANYGTQQIRATQTVIKALVAAGVTVFAASGDDGIYDCRDSTGTGLGNSASGVDYPASSPQVVGVGGSNLQHAGSKARRNNGHNWHETAWSCSSTMSCEGNGLLPILPAGTGGTGGGESGVPAGLLTASPYRGFAEPGYQKRSIRGATFGHQQHRLVPDISADGDPATGFEVYSSDPELASDRDAHGLVRVGGTSLSSPISAALLTNSLAAAHRHIGVGDIHRALYAAYRKGKGVFRDIRAGTNGAAADRGRDPSVTAHRGYDTVSGLGAVLWPALMPYLHLHKHR
jgi:kumamolisin